MSKAISPLKLYTAAKRAFKRRSGQPFFTCCALPYRLRGATRHSVMQSIALAGKVVLSGNVRSWAERHEAERAAWAAPGVSQVDDPITVVP